MELTNKLTVPCPSEFFFCGCAWACGFYIGAYQGIVDRWGLDHVTANCRFGGNSSGAIIACAMALGRGALLESIYQNLLRFTDKYGVLDKVSIYQEIVIDTLFAGDPLAYAKCNGRLLVGVTEWPWNYRVISKWHSNAALRATLHASMHIPFYMSNIDAVPNCALAIDGGFSNFYCKYSDETLVVSAYTDALTGDICCGLDPALDLHRKFSASMGNLMAAVGADDSVPFCKHAAIRSRRKRAAENKKHSENATNNAALSSCLFQAEDCGEDGDYFNREVDDISTLSLMNCLRNDAKGYGTMKRIGNAKVKQWDGHYTTKHTVNVPLLTVRIPVCAFAFSLRILESFRDKYLAIISFFILLYCVWSKKT